MRDSAGVEQASECNASFWGERENNARDWLPGGRGPMTSIPLELWIAAGLALYMAWAIGANDVA
ncbi:hypothetical protein MK280_04430, partial [Myxococcota bacterium]|nr:hypothetical protein [Myxococcota bacterium]